MMLVESGVGGLNFTTGKAIVTPAPEGSFRDLFFLSTRNDIFVNN